MIGAVPNADWVDDRSLTDHGFIYTGQTIVEPNLWTFERPPAPFETSLPGIFAVGDVRAESVKRVASAVGESSICVQFVHDALAES